MLDLAAIRGQYPALQQRIQGQCPVFLDGPGGTQVPQCVIDAVAHYLGHTNANCGGSFRTSRQSDGVLLAARQAVADLLQAGSPEEIVFGQNMTSLTFHVSRSLARTWQPGDAIVVTRLDHDANIRPWVLAAADAGVEVRWVDVREADATLDLDDLRRQLQGRVRLLAITCASNSVGTMPDVAELCRLARGRGALVFLDAVHYAPHARIDVTGWDCDFLACSAYKFFGPHVGILWGRQTLLRQLMPYKVRPASEAIPDRWMTGTQNHEGIAGVLAAIDYLASLGQGSSRSHRLDSAFQVIREYETQLTQRLLEGIARLPAWRVHGLTAASDLPRRAPTLALTHAHRSAQEAASHLAEREIYAWAGHFYAIELADRLNVNARGGFLRLGMVHYNTAEEVDRTVAALAELS